MNTLKVTQMLNQLRTAGITAIYASYSGSGDSGQMDECGGVAEPITDPADVDWQLFEPTLTKEQKTIIKQHERTITDFLAHALDLERGGWENNEGGCGTVVHVLGSDTVYLDHSYYIETTEHDPSSISLATVLS